MRFLQDKKIKKTIIVISDLHLSAGMFVDGKRNPLEDFHYDKELVEFMEYHRSQYKDRELELIINGDFFDFLAVPFVKYFDDEYWSEEASMEKLKIILNAHPEVISALKKFIEFHQVTIMIGNHDGELIHPALQDYFIKQFPKDYRKNITIKTDASGEYSPVKGVLIKHGHEYELANKIDLSSSIVEDSDGKRHFSPPWGSYYVTRVINRFKEERDYINMLHPIKRAIINGLIYDTVYMSRFLIANAFYFIRVRLMGLFKEKGKAFETIIKTLSQIEIFQNVDALSENFFKKNPDIGCLILGHTHKPVFRTFSNGRSFINTGTWIDMHYLDWGKSHHIPELTYARIDVHEKREDTHPTAGLDIALNVWKGQRNDPFVEF